MGNHNSGRRAKPTALHILRGNPSHKRLIDDIVPPAGAVEKPGGLSVDAGVVWDGLAPILLAMGTLTTADVRAFARLCELEATAQQASAQKDTEGFEFFKDDCPHPCLRVERETATALRPYYDYFGMTPSSRARIVVPKAQTAEQESKWAGALK